MTICTCPACGQSDEVEAMERHVGSMKVASEGDQREAVDAKFYCGRRNLLFTGSDHEWAAGRLGTSSLRDWRSNGGRRPPAIVDPRPGGA